MDPVTDGHLCCPFQLHLLPACQAVTGVEHATSLAALINLYSALNEKAYKVIRQSHLVRDRIVQYAEMVIISKWGGLSRNIMS